MLFNRVRGAAGVDARTTDLGRRNALRDRSTASLFDVVRGVVHNSLLTILKSEMLNNKRWLTTQKYVR